MFQELRASLGLLVFFVLLTGIGYPLLMTGLGETFFPYQASGSLIQKDGKIIGSALIGQTFTSDKYFHARPSAAGDGYDAGNSSGSNLAPSSPDLIKTISARVADLQKGGETRPIPADLVMASGSGLDPDISVAAAKYQIPRIVEARGLPLPVLETLVANNTTPRSFGVLGENRVNVLSLNQALDLLAASAP